LALNHGLRRKGVNAVAASNVGERHQQAQHCRRWQRAARGDGVGAGTEGESVQASGSVGERG
jgi:hypothetical protein